MPALQFSVPDARAHPNSPNPMGYLSARPSFHLPSGKLGLLARFTAAPSLSTSDQDRLASA